MADFTSALDAAPARAVKVLLVADDPAVLDTCAQRLEAAGIRTATARTGFEAIVKACWHVPDAIIMQDGLLAGEGVDGSVAAQMIRVCPPTAHIPVVDAQSVDALQASGPASREFALLAQVARELSAR
ncbi:MAG TPA: hypothetical protein VK886_15690 [Vicinamibacterales bacterium]|nr:hypothetical protein [Vicinamibacterales bacterium]